MRAQKKRTLIEERICLEAELLRQLEHPNIIGFRGFAKGGDENASILAMELGGKSLGDIIMARIEAEEDFVVPEPFQAKVIQKVAYDVGKALEYLHEKKKILHGDVKSANVLIFGNFDMAKLCDFGVARKIKDNGEIEGVYAATQLWTPMEALKSQKRK